MLRPVYSKRFERDLKRVTRRGKDAAKLKDVIKKLIQQEKLDARYKNHPLQGTYKGCYDCHIEPDWILIYRIKHDLIQFIRTGSHADLFR